MSQAWIGKRHIITANEGDLDGGKYMSLHHIALCETNLICIFADFFFFATIHILYQQAVVAFPYSMRVSHRGTVMRFFFNPIVTLTFHSFSRSANGNVVYESYMAAEHLVTSFGHYNDKRSPSTRKGVEFESVVYASDLGLAFVLSERSSVIMV